MSFFINAERLAAWPHINLMCVCVRAASFSCFHVILVLPLSLINRVVFPRVLSVVEGYLRVCVFMCILLPVAVSTFMILCVFMCIGVCVKL